MKQFSIVIPVYNEGKMIQKTVSEIRSCLEPNYADSYEIIAVNDCSTDNCEEILDKIKTDYISVIHHPINKGYGASLKTGIKHSKYDWVVIIDADNTYPAKSIPELLKYIPEYDMVVGARTKKGVKIPFLRKLPKWCLNKLANYLSQTKIPDLNSGLRVMKKTFIERFISILPNGFSFTTTITLAAFTTNDYHVKYVPIDYYQRRGAEKSKIKPIKDTLNFIQLIIKTVLYFNPLKIFVPLSIILFVSGITILIGRYFFTPFYRLEITIITLILTAIQMLAIGMLAELIIKSRR